MVDITNSNPNSINNNDFGYKQEDSLELIDKILSVFLNDKTKEADLAAKSIETASNAIAEINRLWGLVMKDNLPDTDPNKTGTTTQLGGGTTTNYLYEIDEIIKNELQNSDGIKAITGSDYSKSIQMPVNYGQLQSMNATMTAYCDTIQVDLDTHQQEFKNIMTKITSAQEELRDVRRNIITLAQQG